MEVNFFIVQQQKAKYSGLDYIIFHLRKYLPSPTNAMWGGVLVV